MALQHYKTTLNILMTILVAGIVLAAFALSGAAALENLRFIRATDQILEPVGLLRSIIAQQPSYSQNPEEDVWADLARIGRVPSATTHPNPWGSDVRVFAITNAAVRVESDLPTHDCRRMALYFLNQAQGFGIIAIEAQPFGRVVWSAIYPLPANMPRDRLTDIACGNAAAARLALVFKVR